ncbi:unnamed protein product [Amoebophrya sp. A25]|nr:unnamed protein product [Amoebophrya sp. A25]|eukprot:GSA25T00006191001.1
MLRSRSDDDRCSVSSSSSSRTNIVLVGSAASGALPSELQHKAFPLHRKHTPSSPAGENQVQQDATESGVDWTGRTLSGENIATSNPATPSTPGGVAATHTAEQNGLKLTNTSAPSTTTVLGDSTTSMQITIADPACNFPLSQLQQQAWSSTSPTLVVSVDQYNQLHCFTPAARARSAGAAAVSAIGRARSVSAIDCLRYKGSHLRRLTHTNTQHNKAAGGEEGAQIRKKLLDVISKGSSDDEALKEWLNEAAANGRKPQNVRLRRARVRRNIPDHFLDWPSAQGGAARNDPQGRGPGAHSTSSSAAGPGHQAQEQANINTGDSSSTTAVAGSDEIISGTPFSTSNTASSCNKLAGQEEGQNTASSSIEEQCLSSSCFRRTRSWADARSAQDTPLFDGGAAANTAGVEGNGTEVGGAMAGDEAVGSENEIISSSTSETRRNESAPSGCGSEGQEQLTSNDTGKAPFPPGRMSPAGSVYSSSDLSRCESDGSFEDFVYDAGHSSCWLNEGSQLDSMCFGVDLSTRTPNTRDDPFIAGSSSSSQGGGGSLDFPSSLQEGSEAFPGSLQEQGSEAFPGSLHDFPGSVQDGLEAFPSSYEDFPGSYASELHSAHDHPDNAAARGTGVEASSTSTGIGKTGQGAGTNSGSYLEDFPKMENVEIAAPALNTTDDHAAMPQLPNLHSGDVDDMDSLSGGEEEAFPRLSEDCSPRSPGNNITGGQETLGNAVAANSLSQRGGNGGSSSDESTSLSSRDSLHALWSNVHIGSAFIGSMASGAANKAAKMIFPSRRDTAGADDASTAMSGMRIDRSGRGSISDDSDRLSDSSSVPDYLTSAANQPLFQGDGGWGLSGWSPKLSPGAAHGNTIDHETTGYFSPHNHSFQPENGDWPRLVMVPREPIIDPEAFLAKLGISISLH